MIKFLILQNTHPKRKLNEPLHFRTTDFSFFTIRVYMNLSTTQTESQSTSKIYLLVFATNWILYKIFWVKICDYHMPKRSHSIWKKTHTQECRSKEKNHFSIIIFVEPGGITESGDDNLHFWILEGSKTGFDLFPSFLFPVESRNQKQKQKVGYWGRILSKQS